MKKHFIFYCSLILFFGIACWLVISHGEYVHGRIPIFAGEQDMHNHQDNGVLTTFMEHATNPLSMLLLQIIIIVGLSRIFGFLFRLAGQPAVVGEIISGIILGPSLIGSYFPGFSAFVFPAGSLQNLQLLSQIGLAFFMFIVGMELDLTKLRARAGDALVISHASISLNYFLGVVLSYFLFDAFAPPGISFLSFALFMGIAMSITAFPVLARILQERKLTKSTLGGIALTTAAIDDITAWCILAVIIGLVKASNPTGAVLTILLTVLFVIIMFRIVSPLLNRLQKKNIEGKYSRTVIILALFVLFSSAYCTQLIGIHGLVGAFLAGTIMPDNLKFREVLKDKLEDVSVLILLPIFFVVTGLRTQVGLLNEGHMWITCLVIILVAVIGKVGGVGLASRVMGLNWKDSWSLGVLMNTRGLMQMVVLNIGYDMGILSPEIFAIMVLMALSTTFMTGPLLSLILKMK